MRSAARAFAILAFLAPCAAAAPAPDVFVVKPYLQLGDASGADLRLLWQADDKEAAWAVEYQVAAGRPWRKAPSATARRVAVAGVAPHRVFETILAGLEPGVAFRYRVARDGKVVFGAGGHGRKGAGQPYRFAAFGDCGVASAEQKAIAHRTHLSRPDFVMITGDIVYDRGRVSEYRDKFWPVYNADEASPEVGAPLLRSTLFLAAPGNHDIAARDLGKYPDGLAYFLYWDQPRNGPPGHPAALVPSLRGSEANRKAFLTAAGGSYPGMANFSFDYGNAHWTVIDANPYVDWTDREIRAWVERDLAAARGATWRFVAFHHPGFHSAKTHAGDQQMRRLAEIFEAGKVDVVFSGHVHNYQRSFPLRFVHDGKPAEGGGEVGGRWALDKTFDGRTDTTPQGIIYLVTGAGGAHLYNPEQHNDPASWQEFTAKFHSRLHSLTLADVDGPKLTIRQVAADGMELDRFVVTK